MTRIAYIERRFSSSSLATIQMANAIIAEYQAQGFELTLRQLYYQFVARGVIPNSMKSYKSLGSIINDGRLAGKIDWEAIEDRTRNLEQRAAWDSPSDVILAAARSYHIHMWEHQQYAPEVWVEKEALVGVVARVCRELSVPYFACRGYTSQSEQWRAGMRLSSNIRSGREPVIFHLGDHDPSGIDMTRDNTERLGMFAGRPIDLRRLALNMDQIDALSPPPNPAKATDSRFEDYRANYGDESWELDALDPSFIEALIRENVTELIDQEQWDADEERLVRERKQLTATHERWGDVVDFLGRDE